MVQSTLTLHNTASRPVLVDAYLTAASADAPTELGYIGLWPLDSSNGTGGRILAAGEVLDVTFDTDRLRDDVVYRQDVDIAVNLAIPTMSGPTGQVLGMQAVPWGGSLTITDKDLELVPTWQDPVSPNWIDAVGFTASLIGFIVFVLLFAVVGVMLQPPVARVAKSGGTGMFGSGKGSRSRFDEM
jgi:hypothetical protein